MKPFGFIYETTNNINGKKYIGKCIYSRKNNWKTYLGSGTYLKRAIKKYGADSFSRVILEECFSEKELNDLEELYIKKFNAAFSDEYYNLKESSIGGDTFTNNPNKEYTRLLKSINSSGERNPQYGKPKSKRMLEAVKESNSKPIIIDQIQYSSLTEASISLNIKLSTINYRLNSKGFPEYIRLPKEKNRVNA